MGCVRFLIARPESANSILIDLRVQPGAAKTRAVGFETDIMGVARLKLQIRARPVDGAANTAVIAWVAKSFGIPKRDVALVRGQKSRSKTVQIKGPTGHLLVQAQNLIGEIQ
mgnify:FL=1